MSVLSGTYWLEKYVTPPLIDNACCPQQEFGRVRSVAFIRKRYLQQILLNPTNLAVWEAGISSGDIEIIALTSGRFDSGNSSRLKGYGRRPSTHGPRDMLLNFNAPFIVDSIDFFNDLDKRMDYVPAFRTNSLVHLCDSNADISVKEVVEEDLETTLYWTVECLIRSRNLPRSVNLASLISLFNCANIPIPPGSSGYWIDSNGAYLVDSDGSKLILS